MFSGISDEVGAILLLIVAQAAESYATGRYDKVPCRISTLTGDMYIKELVNQNHPRRIQEVFRMPLNTLRELETFLLENSNLQSSRAVGITEKIAMFLHVVAHHGSNRQVQERYQHSGSTVSRYFNEVLQALFQLHVQYVRLPESPYLPCARISEDPKYTPYFDDCIGAIDGTHIPIHMLAGEGIPYRNRKDFTSQNVLAACNFDMQFTYILPGWEGSAHDGRVLGDAMNGKGFTIPKGKYYLGDAGYSNSNSLLVPYKGVRYHLKE